MPVGTGFVESIRAPTRRTEPSANQCPVASKEHKCRVMNGMGSLYRQASGQAAGSKFMIREDKKSSISYGTHAEVVYQHALRAIRTTPA
jgi:hypothetical protein